MQSYRNLNSKLHIFFFFLNFKSINTQNSTTMNNELLDEFESENFKEMPPMINVLSILTFVYSGLIILSSTWYLMTIEKRAQEFYDSMEKLENISPFLNKFQEIGQLTIENPIFLNSLEIFVALFCTVGAILMRRVLKTGFYIYTLSTLTYIAGNIYIYGLGIGIIYCVFISILFLILYGVNFKHLK